MSVDNKDLREQFVNRRKALTSSEIDIASELACKRLTELSVFKESKNLGCYLAVNGEINPAKIVSTALNAGKNVYLPVLNHESLLFAPLHQHSTFTKNRFGISEPECDAKLYVPASKLNLVVVPLLAFDNDCNRLGMGAGFYDRALANTVGAAPFKAGLAYDWQHTQNKFLAHELDIAMDLIISDQKMYSANHC